MRRTRLIAGGYGYAFLASVAFSVYALINRYVYITYDVPVFKYTITFLAAGSLFALLGLAASSTRKSSIKYDKSIIWTVVNGVAAGSGLAVFVYGQGFTTATNASILATSTIISTALFSAVLLKDKLSREQAPWFFLMFAGFYIAIVGVRGISLNKGDIYVICSSLILGMTNALSKKLMKTFPSQFLADMRLLSGGLFFALIGFLVYGKGFIVTYAGFWPLIAGFFFWLTIRSFYAAIHHINPNRAIIIASSHPIFTPIVGAILLSESYTWNKPVGAILLIISIYYINTRRAKG